MISTLGRLLIQIKSTMLFNDIIVKRGKTQVINFAAGWGDG